MSRHTHEHEHLDEHAITAAVAGLELDRAAEEHLGSCLVCRRQVTGMQKLLAARRAEIIGQAPDWKQQQQQILARLPASPKVVPIRRHQWLRPLIAAAAVVLMAVAIGVMNHGGTALQPQATPIAEELAVDEILAEVDAILEADGFPGFEALGPIVPDSDEIESFANGTS
jgi:hypothetical protein